MKHLRFVLVIIGIGFAKLSFGQTVTYTSFLPGYSFNTTHQGIALTGPGDPNPVIAAFQFTAGVTGPLDSVRVPIRYLWGHSDITISVYGDNSGQVGSLMKTWQISSLGGWHIDTVTNSDSSIVITSGTQYWLQLGSLGDGVHYWGKSLQGGLMQSAYIFNNSGIYSYGNSDEFPAYEVSVVPEPASLIALSLGVLLIRRRKGK